jgi:hypothetical protein
MANDQYSTVRFSSWDNRGLSTSWNPSRSIQNISSIPISPTTNYVVPLSTYSYQNSSQYNTDRRQIQQYQQSKYQSQPIKTDTSNTR